MQELLTVLRAIPRPIRVLATFFLLVPLAFAVARLLGMSTKWAALFCVGLLVILLILWGFNALLRSGEKKRAKSFEGNLGLQSRQAGVGKEEVREALAELSEKWQLAVAQLREAGLSIYGLPWYLLIGEPQSGKSTTLQNSGLEFPVGADALSGAGGTRNCDWWFSNEAVILDTAGRFTFQEESAPDAQEWSAFLRLLKKHRKYCPINGVIVVIPATSLVEDTPEEQERKAKNIRQKLLHLQKVMEIRFPVFVLVTKADRVLGFSEFFSKLEPAEQRQLFGWSNPEQFDKAWDAKTFPQAFADIVGRVHKLRMRFLHKEGNLSQIDKLFVFPEELAALQEPLATYFHTVFAGSRYEEPFIFRGFYITSGLQQGKPIARACRDLLRVQVGDPQGVLEDLESVFRKSRAFFIHDFYSKKAFQEQGLIARTRAAMKRDRVNRWVLYGLGAVVIPLLLFALGIAAFNLYSRLSPINKTVTDARRCLQTSAPCSLAESWELIERIERHKRALAESRWVMRLMLRGGTRNEITRDLLPAIQGQIFRLSVYPALLASAEARAGRLDWGAHQADYEPLLETYRQLLRVREHRAEADPGRQKELRAEMRLEPMVTFCRRTKGLDDSAQGREIDGWLAGDMNSFDLDLLFKDMVNARHELASGPGPEPIGAGRAFKDYWTVRNLGRWDATLYFKTYADLLDRLGRFDSTSGGAEAANSAAAELLGAFAKNWDDGTAAMSADRPELLLRRPGRGLPEWVQNCKEDYGSLADISRRVAGNREIEAHCGAIPEAWRSLIGRREDYAYLYTETRGDKGLQLAWSENAKKLRDPLAELAELVKPSVVQATISKFESTLRGLGGASERLDEVSAHYKGQEKLLFTPADAVDAFDQSNPPAQFDSSRVAAKTREVAALALAVRTLPPIETYFVDEVFRNCGDCYTRFYAQSHVTAANKLLSWGRRTLQPIRGQVEVFRRLASVSNAEYDYLREAIRRSGRGGGGDERPGTVTFPSRAVQAGRWADFTREIRQWRLAGGDGGAAPSSGGAGVTVDDVQEFARDNDDLRPLLREFAGGGGRRSASPSLAAEEAMRAAQAFQRCVAGLDDAPLRAWKQLALKRDGASLADFHAFSSNPRLRGSVEADRLKGVEDHGAGLLSKEIRPDFQDRSQELWRRVDRCCLDRFPFITERALRRQADVFERGPTGGAPWSAPTLDRGRREATAVLTLETLTSDAMDQLFYQDETLDRLFDDFALDPIVSGEERAVDFVGSEREKLRTLRQWQRFLFPPREESRQEDRGKKEFTIRLLERPAGTGRTYIGERAGRVDLFGPYTIRPSTDANRGVTRSVPLVLDDRPQSVSAVNEDRNGWTGRLELRGGPLKLLYFVQLASVDRPRQDGRVWTVRVEVPDFDRPELRPEGIFEITFDRPLPGVFPDLGSDD
jgi:hypothetical protein